MKIQEEKSFPRGGKKLTENKTKVLKDDSFKRKREASQSFPQNKNTKKIKLKPPAELREITVKTLSEGMILLGCVREVHATELKINLPGRIIGYVSATNISEEYSAFLKNAFDDTEVELVELNHIFKPGQFVITKVEEVVVSDETFKVTLTLNPNAIYSDLSFRDVVNGIVISASVQSVEDHGYVMNCGVHGVRAFLKKSCATNFEETWNENKSLAVGQVLRCLVVKCSISDGCSSVEFQVDPEIVTESKLEDVPLKSIIPGMLFVMTVTKITTAGVVVKFSGDNTGFVHANHLNVGLNYIEKGAILSGRILYIEPLTKNVFLTTLDNVGGLRPLPLSFQNFGKGTIFRHAKVTNINGGHLILKLDEDNDIYGYVTSQQMDIESAEDHVALSEQLKKIYPIDSLQKCKVLEYDYMLQKYNCTLRKKIIKQKFTCLEEVSPGIVTTCRVVKSTPREILLQVGAVRGIVEPMHCTDVPVKCPDTLLQVGQKVKAKVLSVKIPICEFTLKPALVHSENPTLTGFSDAQYDVPYDGVIVKKSPHGVLVKFYGGFVQFVPYKRMEGWKEELERSYYFGQVVICYVKEIDSVKQTISFRVEPHPLGGILKDEDTKEKFFRNIDRGPFKVGKLYKVSVEDVTPEGLTVRVKANDTVGWIPPTQLTDCPELAQFLCQTYKKGEELHAFCLRSKDRPLFTLSPTFMKYFESQDGKKIKKFGISAIASNMVVPSTVIEIHDESITVAIPLPDGEYHVSIKKIHICNGTVEEVASLNIQIRQTLMVQVTDLLIRGGNGTTKLSRVWNKNLMSELGIMLLQDYLTCHKKIHTFLRNEGHPLGQLVIGSKVKGTVLGANLLGAVIKLENGAKAVLMPEHYKDIEIQENMIIEGTVLFVDLINQCVEITMSPTISKHLLSLSKQQFVGRTPRCVTYVSRSDVVMAGIKFGKHSQIAYIPSRWHINDLRPSPYYTVGEAGKVVVKIHKDELIIAVPRKVAILEKKYKRDVNTREDKHANCSEKVNDFDISINTSVSSENGVNKKNTKNRNDSGAVSKHVSSNDILEHVDNTKNKLNHKSVNNVGEFSVVDICKKGDENDTCEKGPIGSENGPKKSKKEDKNYISLSSESRVKKKKKNADSNEDSIVNNNSKQACDNDILEHVDSIKNKLKRKSVDNVGEFSIVDISKKGEDNDTYEKEPTESENGPKKSKKESKNDTSISSESRVKKKKKNADSNEDSIVNNNSKHACDNDILEHVDSIKNKLKLKSVNNVGEFSVVDISKKGEDNDTYEKKPTESENGPKKSKKESKNDTSISSVSRVKKKKKNADSNEDSIVNNNSKQACDNDILEHVDSIKNKLKLKSVNNVGEFSVVDISKKGEDNDTYEKEPTESENGPKKSKKESKNDTSISSESRVKKKKKNADSNEDIIVNNNSKQACDNDIMEHVEGTKTKIKKKSINNLGDSFVVDISEKKKEICAESDNSLEENEKGSRNENDPVHFKTVFIAKKRPERKKGTKETLIEVSQNCLDVRAGFVWNATPDQLPIVAKQNEENGGSSSDDESEEDSKKKKQQLTIAEKRTLAREEEVRLRKTEERLLSADKNPQSADDFDRLVMSAPNNSQNWIKYMAYHLQATEIEKARAVAERALKTICFREEQEKLNVWIALLNLENLFGTQESLAQTLEEAVKVNDEFKVRMQVLNMYSTTKKFEELGKMVQVLTKKYKDDKKTWIEAGMAYMKCGEVEKSRQLMQRALNVLQKKDHVEVLTRFALMENDLGESERAESIMEKILTSYPKRVDVWNVYVDMLVKSKKLEIARRVLDRAVIQKLPANKMKSLFKKYLKFENDYGTHEGVERVREMAKSYVENVNT